MAVYRKKIGVMNMNEEDIELNCGAKGMDMLHGPLLKKLILFALPIAASSILQQLFNSADVAVAGRFAESGALAAVGSDAFFCDLWDSDDDCRAFAFTFSFGSD